MASRILVTGGAGYIGSHTCLCLLEQGYETVVFDNLVNSSLESLKRVEKLTNKSIPFENVDLTHTDLLEKSFEKHGPFAAVLHFASLKAVGESVQKPLMYYRNNLDGLISLVSVMEKNQCNRLIFSSSATVYGVPETLPLTEDSQLGPTNPYGHTKLMIEQILRDVCVANKNFAVTCLRYFNPVGAHPSGQIGEDPSGIPNNLMPYLTQVACGRREYLTVFGNDWPTHDGTGVRDYLHVMDLGEGHVAALNHMHKTGWKTYNLGTGKGVSVLDLLHALEKASGKTIRYEVGPRRAGDIATCFADASLAEKELKWKATRNLKEMCEDSWKWQCQNPNGYTSV